MRSFGVLETEVTIFGRQGGVLSYLLGWQVWLTSCIHKSYGWNEYWVLSNPTLVLLLSGFSCAVMLDTAHLTYMRKFKNADLFTSFILFLFIFSPLV